ncbi:hypothetical protein [Oceanobacillus neutriphilus]|uniref:Uncharacterized protein n=1 Tax=Oceanobacillus neutriphilus TaxID=531815 RepID=A0ABQ2NY64_9BACI|nr:hypothetical protein [Oceanobacillus neutriphilus]GGP13498.1 hypothetical protein GCM10011346_33730 [Oceanobacillus neutriphilus]
MKIVETHDIHENDGYEDSGKGSLTIKVYNSEGDKVASAWVAAGEPEDAVFFRDLYGAYGIIDVVKAAYQAGKDGEDVEFEFIDEQAPEPSPIAR